MVDAAYPFDVAATLRLAHAESGRFDVLGDDQLVRCVNPEREYLTWFYGVDGDDGELVDYHELDDFEAASIERSKALASIASPKVDVALVEREELDERRRERGEAVTDGGVEQDVDRTDRGDFSQFVRHARGRRTRRHVAAEFRRFVAESRRRPRRMRNYDPPRGYRHSRQATASSTTCKTRGEDPGDGEPSMQTIVITTHPTGGRSIVPARQAARCRRWRLPPTATMPEQDHENADRATCSEPVSGRRHGRTLERRPCGQNARTAPRPPVLGGYANTPGRP